MPVTGRHSRSGNHSERLAGDTGFEIRQLRGVCPPAVPVETMSNLQAAAETRQDTPVMVEAGAAVQTKRSPHLIGSLMTAVGGLGVALDRKHTSELQSLRHLVCRL